MSAPSQNVPSTIASKPVRGPVRWSAFACTIFLLAAPALAGFGFTDGNLVVVRVGDGAATLGSAAAATFLVEYAADGTAVQTVAMPTVASGSNQPLTNAGSATSEGFLNLSTNGQYLVQAGYAAAPGTASVAGTTTATVNRVIARTDLNGTIDTSTALSDTSHSGSNIRSATSTDGTQFWTAGTASSSANGGVRYVASLGASTSIQISSSVTNTRVVRIFGGQLYVSSASGAFLGVSTVGTGLPTTSGETTTLIAGATGESAYDYFFSNASTLYIADDRTSASGGIQKWTESGGTWTLQYTLNPATGVGCRGLTGAVVGSQTVLWATTTQSNANSIVRVVDAGVGSPFTTVATTAANTAFRGIRLLPIECESGPDCDTDGIPDACELALGFGTDLNDNGIPDDCEQNGGTRFCFGDTGCPCGNNVMPGTMQGCAWGPFIGAMLAGAGNTSVTSDTLALNASNLPLPALGSSSILFFQGDARTSTPFGDGKRCAGGTMVRLGIKTYSGTTSGYPQGGDPSVSVRGMIPGAGGSFVYQGWFRVFPSFCGTGSNLTNAVSVVWMP